MRYQIMASVLAILMIDLDKVCKAEDPKQQQRERSLKTEHLAQSDLVYAASLAHDDKEEKLNGPIESATESQRSLRGGTDYHHDTTNVRILQSDQDSDQVGDMQAGQNLGVNRNLKGGGFGKMGGGGGMGGYGKRGGMGGMDGYSKGKGGKNKGGKGKVGKGGYGKKKGSGKSKGGYGKGGMGGKKGGKKWGAGKGGKKKGKGSGKGYGKGGDFDYYGKGKGNDSFSFFGGKGKGTGAQPTFSAPFSPVGSPQPIISAPFSPVVSPSTPAPTPPRTTPAPTTSAQSAPFAPFAPFGGAPAP